MLGAFGAPGTSGCSRCPADSEFIFTALPGESVVGPFEYSEAAPHGGVRASSSAQRPSALESQDSKLSPARHGPGSDASVGTARHQRRLRRRDQLRGRGRGRPLAAVSTAPVPAEEASGDPLHRRLRRGRAPGGRTILRRAGMRRGGGPLGVPVTAPRDHDPDARTDGGTRQQRDSELVQQWRGGLNAPTGAWCSLTQTQPYPTPPQEQSQCTYRCVVLPDGELSSTARNSGVCLNAPTGAWCSLTRRRCRSHWRRYVSMHLQVRGAP